MINNEITEERLKKLQEPALKSLRLDPFYNYMEKITRFLKILKNKFGDNFVEKLFKINDLMERIGKILRQ